MKKGWFEVVNHPESGDKPLFRGSEEKGAMLYLHFFAYTDERLRGVGDSYYPDAVFELAEMYDEEAGRGGLGYWALFEVNIVNQGMDPIGNELTELWQKMNESHSPQLSDFLDMCRENFDAGRAILLEHQKAEYVKEDD